MGVPKLAFKKQGGDSYRFEPFSSGGVSGANSRTEGSVNSWNKLNEEAITEASIGSIDNIDNIISELTIQLRDQKEKLKKLIEDAEGLKNTTCESHSSIATDISTTCTVKTKLSTYASSEIESLQQQIKINDNMILFLGYLKTYLGFTKPNNMYYRIEG